MEKQKMTHVLQEIYHSDYQCVPIWLNSFDRADDAPSLGWLDNLDATMTPLVNVRVLVEQLESYQEKYPNLTFHPASMQSMSPVGTARQILFDTIYYTHGHSRAIIMDDDLTELNLLTQSFSQKGKSAGAESSRGYTRAERADMGIFYDAFFKLFSRVSEEVLDSDGDVILGSARKRHMSFGYKNHRIKYQVNSGVSARQLMFFDFERFNAIGAAIDQEHFYRHGDDIGTMASVLANGGKTFTLPSFIYDTYSEDVNIYKSKIRNASTKPELHAEEYHGLQQYPIKDYLREKRSLIDGTYEWGDVDWRKYHKLHGTKPDTKYWEPGGTEPQVKLI